MPKPKKVNPAKSTPQAPRVLRVGSKGRARAEAAKAAGEPPPSAETDDDEDEDGDDEDEDGEKDQAAHDAAMAKAAEDHRSAADCADAAAGTDSAAALMAYEDAHDAAMESGGVAKASAMKMRGAEAEEAPPDSQPAPAAPTAPGARAIAAAAPVATAAAHLEVAQLAKLGRDVMLRTGAQSAAAAMLKLESALLALDEVGKLRAADTARAAGDNLRARTERLVAAVHAGMPRAQAFHVKPDGKVGAPKSAWMGGTLQQLDAQLNELGYKAGAPASRSTLIVASEDGGDEAGLAARAEAAGVDIATRRAAEANLRRSQHQENAR